MSESTEGNGSVEAEERPSPRQGVRTGEPPEAFARSGVEPPPAAPKRPLYKRPVPVIIFCLIVIAGIVIGVLWWLHARQFEETDDAFIEADVTQVSPRVAGHVDRVYITDNQLVHQGDKLVDLDPRDLQAKVNEAKAAVVATEKQLQQSKDNAAGMQASVGAAKAAEEAAQTEANRAHNELARYEHLNSQAVTEQQMINLRAAAASGDANLAAAKQRTVVAQANVSSAEAQVQVSQAQVDQAQASLNEADLQLSYTKISAPITGRVTNRSVNPGDYVQVGQSLLALVPQDVYVIANY
ncbi:MAG TPA: HlyD family secretion protein, partial [Tepidisphaeraceae bacterium]|nr:HlyD family secretion protein [Tepidisphaeraceae bacterium]